MERTDRRTFLTGGLRAGAAVALAGAAGTGGAAALAGCGTSWEPAGGAPGSTGSTGLRARSLSVNGMGPAVGVDPDDLSFAWELEGGGRGGRQTAWRVVLWEAPPNGATHGAPPDRPLWDSGTVRSSRQAFVPYRGPRLTADTDYRWSVTVHDQAGRPGPWAPTASVVTGLRTADWTARWLRPGPAGAVPEEYAYLRTVVRPGTGVVVRATAYVAAAHKYQLWVNGVMVDTGPCFAFPDQSYCQATDLTAHIRPGRENAVGLLHHWYGAGNGRPAAVPGALVQLSVVHADGHREVFGTGPGWREHPGEWLPAPPRNTEANDFVEIIDGRAHPHGWARPGFDDRRWAPARVLGPVGTAPFTGLVAQRTRMAEHPVVPVAVRTLPGGTVVADFGRIVAARPMVAFARGLAGRTVSLRAGYLLDRSGRVSALHGNQGTDMGFTYIQRDGAQVVDPFTYLGFRYLEVDGAGEALGPHQVTARARHAAMPPVAPATFTSSVPMLDRVWGLCAHAALYSCQEQFVDTPTRQKGQFAQDSTNESQAVMGAYGDRNQSWQGLRDFARSQARFWPDGRINDIYPDGSGATDIPDDTETYVEWVWRYYEHTGDRATLAALYPVVERIAGYVWAAVDPATGLVTNLPGGGTDYTYGVVDWPPQMRYGYDMATVARTEVNVLAVNVFTRAAAMARALGDPAGAAPHDARRLALTAAVNARLVRSDGIYVDGMEANGTPSTHASQLANALALAYGVVPADRVGAVGRYTASLGISLGPDHGLELLRGLQAGGRAHDIVALLSDPAGPGWANIVASGGTYTWESWTPSDLEQDSLSHGWGSSALVGMQEALLGVGRVPPDPTAGPGSPRTTPLTITAPPQQLGAVAGVVPTVAGPVEVAWTRHPGTLTLTLVLPPNMSARLALPTKRPAAVTESGTPVGPVGGPGVDGVTVTGTAEGVVHLEVAAGTYRFTSPGG